MRNHAVLKSQQQDYRRQSEFIGGHYVSVAPENARSTERPMHTHTLPGLVCSSGRWQSVQFCTRFKVFFNPHSLSGMNPPQRERPREQGRLGATRQPSCCPELRKPIWLYLPGGGRLLPFSQTWRGQHFAADTWNWSEQFSAVAVSDSAVIPP